MLGEECGAHFRYGVTHQGGCQLVKKFSFPIFFLGLTTAAREPFSQRTTRTCDFVLLIPEPSSLRGDPSE